MHSFLRRIDRYEIISIIINSFIETKFKKKSIIKDYPL